MQMNGMCLRTTRLDMENNTFVFIQFPGVQSASATSGQDSPKLPKPTKRMWYI